MPHTSLPQLALQWCAGLLLAAACLPTLAIDMGQLGKAKEALGNAESAISTGKEVISTSKEAVAGARQWLKPNAINSSRSSDSATVRSYDAGTQRLIATLDDTLSASARRGEAVLSLRDQGPYLVQRQSAFVTPAAAQWLASPLSDSPVVAINLAAEPAGALFDFSTGQVRMSGRGVKIFVLSAHANLPRRSDRRTLDAIEQHAMLHASSVQLEWPRQAQDSLEPTGGQLLVWASGDGVLFPSGFGPDGKLFTRDDPLMSLSRGYTVVQLDRRGFRLDRSREAMVSLHAVLPATDLDLSRLGYVDAFRAFISLMSERYPHSTIQSLPWPQLQAELLERATAAAQKRDLAGYAQVFADIGQRLRDGQFQVTLPDGVRLYPGSALPDLGLTSQPQLRGGATVPLPRVWLLDNGRGMVSDVAPGSAAAQAGLRPGAEILDIAGEPLRRYLERGATRVACTTDSSCALRALMLSSNTEASLSIKVSQDGAEQALQLRRPSIDTATPTAAAADAASAFELVSISGKTYGYMVVSSFAQADANLETWERSLASANRAGLPGLILDLRGNHGESTQLVAHFVASFFSYDKPLRLQGDTQRHFDNATRVWRARGGLGLPPTLPLHASGDAYYAGQLILLTGRDCGGACQLFSAWLQRTHRAQVMAAEPSAGGGIGHTMRVSLPDGIVVRVPVVAEISPGGQSYAQGSGVNPDLRIPLDLEFIGKVMRAEDPVLDAAVLQLDLVFSKR